jgi:hypothetical protein
MITFVEVTQLKGMIPKSRVQCGRGPHCTLLFGVPFIELRKS